MNQIYVVTNADDKDDFRLVQGTLEEAEEFAAQEFPHNKTIICSLRPVQCAGALVNQLNATTSVRA